MPLYQLVLKTSAESVPEIIQFVTSNIAMAVLFADQYPSSWPAELWEDGSRICQLTFSEETGSWSVAEAVPGAALVPATPLDIVEAPAGARGRN